MRLRVILGKPLEDWRGTLKRWASIPNRILFVQIEREPGEWVTEWNADWYWFTEDGKVVLETALQGHRHVLGPDGEWTFRIIRPPHVPNYAKAGILVDEDEWRRAQDMVREPVQW